MQDCTGTFGGVFLTTIPPLMAFHAGGERYRDAVNRGVAGLRRWLVTDQRGTWTQFAASKVSDTVAATLSIGTHRSEASSRAIAWLLDRQRVALSTTGARRTARPGHGWNFDETAHRHPDCDTTSSVLRVLTPERERHADAFFGGLRWLLAMQNRDGGWPSWRRNQRKPPGRFLEAASAALVDPSEIDITCRVLIMLGDLEREEPAACKAIRPAIRKALRFLRRKQRPDGSWFGRFNVGFAYGTCEALEALACCGQPRDHQVARALEMLKAAQNPDGGWGESKACYRSNRFEHGASNPYTTGAVLAALLRWEAASEEIYGAGLHYLLSTQSEDGMWPDTDWHGVLVPGVSYFRYGFMATHKALLALDRYLERHQDSSAHGPPSRPS
jgi:squalene cyclase